MMTWNKLSSTTWKDLRAATRIRAKKPLEQSQEKVQNLGKEEHEHEWTYQYHWNDEYGYICTASPAPKKRKVRDDTSEDHEVHDGLSDPTETKRKRQREGAEKRMPRV